MTTARTPKGTAHTPTHRRSLSGKLVALTTEDEAVEHPTRTPTRAAHRRAFHRLGPDHLVELHIDPQHKDALEAWRALAEDEMTRQPVNLRAKKRALAAEMARKAKRGRRQAARSTIAMQANTPAPSRGFLRRLLANANRQAEAAALAEAMERHPAGTQVAA